MSICSNYNEFEHCIRRIFMELYKDPVQPVEKRVEDLLSRMTLKEKAGQLCIRMLGWHTYKRTDNGFELTKAFKDEVEIYSGMGALLGLLRADPWSAVTFDTGIDANNSAKVANMLQRYIIENTRLRIPILLMEDCPHGHQGLDGTLLPTSIGIGSSWNPELYCQAMSYVAAEIRSRGPRVGLVSTLDILRDPRWGRSEECISEDPYLSARFTAAATHGLQGSHSEDLKRADRLAVVLKHFCGQGASVGGRNAAPAPIGERELREIFLPGMEAGVEAGAMSCMSAYNEIDGVACHANKKLLTDILRKEWDFEGFVIADGVAIDNMSVFAGDYESCAALALKSGVDLGLWDKSYGMMEQAVLDGKVSEEYVDRAVKRLLRAKFMLGLFENPYTDEDLAKTVVNSATIRNTNLQMARECIVLLKNENNMLPISNSVKRIAVIGPNADNLYNQLGDYTAPQRDGTGVTVVQGIRAQAKSGTEVLYAKGCGIRNMSTDGFSEAIKITSSSDIAIMVMGGCSARDFNIHFDNNGAAIVSDNPTEMDCGEGVDLANLELGGVQMELIKRIVATGTPVVVVLIQGRPHSIPWIAENCSAIVCGWYPGQQGGKAIAEVLFGNVNPSGKLSVSIPRSVGQLPVYYNYKDKGGNMVYMDMPGTPLYPFGHGLSYTTFVYNNLSISDNSVTISAFECGQKVRVSVDVENTGSVSGAEVVQLYINDMEASVTRRIKELKGFKKVYLKPGEKKMVTFELGKKELAIWDSEMHFTIEPGNVKTMVGGSSETCLEAIFNIT
jgi:beta-glucosidase